MKKCAKKAAGGEVEKEAEDKKDAFKRGGHVKGKKHGGKVMGKKPHGRPDKKARGGDVKSAAGMSAGSPMSGAGKTAEPKMSKNDKEDD